MNCKDGSSLIHHLAVKIGLNGKRVEIVNTQSYREALGTAKTLAEVFLSQAHLSLPVEIVNSINIGGHPNYLDGKNGDLYALRVGDYLILSIDQDYRQWKVVKPKYYERLDRFAEKHGAYPVYDMDEALTDGLSREDVFSLLIATISASSRDTLLEKTHDNVDHYVQATRAVGFDKNNKDAFLQAEIDNNVAPAIQQLSAQAPELAEKVSCQFTKSLKGENSLKVDGSNLRMSGYYDPTRRPRSADGEYTWDAFLRVRGEWLRIEPDMIEQDSSADVGWSWGSDEEESELKAVLGDDFRSLLATLLERHIQYRVEDLADKMIS